MNLDDLTAVWRSQDAAPLHGLNETQLPLALRQDEAKRQKWRRTERWIIYVMSAVFAAGTALCLAKPIYRYEADGASGWDFAFPIVGAAAALISGRAMYVRHRVQALREQSFGESLRDQLNRSIAQLDYQATTLHRTLMHVLVLLAGICPIALLLALSRLNEKSFSDDGYMTVWLSLMCVYGVATGVWELRRQVRDVVLPHKRRLEALLNELDVP
jgi:hypothetical protein